MKITAIPQVFRNVRRGTEIVSILSKYGLADWLTRFNIPFAKDQFKDSDGEALSKHTHERRVRLALTELGPTFIKLGQLFSTRPDVVGVAMASELKLLQSNVRPDSLDKVRQTVESDLGRPIEEIFSEFDPEPIAVASIGQVHRAVLAPDENHIDEKPAPDEQTPQEQTSQQQTGQEVVVKVLRHGIERRVHEDLEVLTGLAQLAEKIEEFGPYQPATVVAEMARTLRRELHFGREQRNLQQFADRFGPNKGLGSFVRIPRVLPHYSTSRVLTMEYLRGIKFADLEGTDCDRQELARRGAQIYLQMIFKDGFFHADPHPGNILVLPNNVIGLLDFGMVGRLDERLREDIEDMLMAIVQSDVRMLTMIIKRIGKCPPDLDESALSIDAADYVGQYASQSLERFDLAGALNDMVEIVRRHKIFLPASVGMLIKTLITLEGTSKMLHPQFSLMEVMQPFHRRMLVRRFSPARQLKKFRRLYSEFEQLAEVLPERIIEILDQVKSGKFDVHLDHRGLEPSVNRLVLGMLTSALFLGSSLMLSRQVPPLIFPENMFWGLHKLSILGLAGCAMSIMLGLRLIRAIGKSGHLDRHREK